MVWPVGRRPSPDDDDDDDDDDDCDDCDDGDNDNDGDDDDDGQLAEDLPLSSQIQTRVIAKSPSIYINQQRSNHDQCQPTLW